MPSADQVPVNNTHSSHKLSGRQTLDIPLATRLLCCKLAAGLAALPISGR